MAKKESFRPEGYRPEGYRPEDYRPEDDYCQLNSEELEGVAGGARFDARMNEDPNEQGSDEIFILDEFKKL